MLRRHTRAAWALNAVIAWCGVVLTLTLTLLGWYVETAPEGHLYGSNTPGWAGAGSRLADSLSYFTEWSNIAVAVSTSLLAWGRRPRGRWHRVLHLSALLMITVTALVYAVLLAPTATIVGWSHVTNPLNHVVVPILTVAVWLAFGPRGEVTPRVLAGSLLLPFAWIAFMLVRGVAVGAYPYGFADVATHGYPTVLRTVLLILVVGLALDAAFWAVDVVLTRRAAARSAARRTAAGVTSRSR